MAKYEIAPTKSNLIKVKRSLEFTKEGHELLEQKRDVLMAELMNVMDAARFQLACGSKYSEGKEDSGRNLSAIE